MQGFPCVLRWIPVSWVSLTRAYEKTTRDWLPPVASNVRSCGGAPLVEMHGNYNTMTCMKCGVTRNVNIENGRCSCGGDCRPDIILFDEYLPQKKLHHVYSRIKMRPSWVVIVGTSLQFSYLRAFIKKAKQRGAKVLHINPDPLYAEKVLKNEEWLQIPAADGLRSLFVTDMKVQWSLCNTVHATYWCIHRSPLRHYRVEFITRDIPRIQPRRTYIWVPQREDFACHLSLQLPCSGRSFHCRQMLGYLTNRWPHKSILTYTRMSYQRKCRHFYER